MDSLEKLTEIFRKFPGIGPRQAKRFVYHILQESPEDVNALIEMMKNAKQNVVLCVSCHRYFENQNKDVTSDADENNSNKNICSICSNSSRDNSMLMLIATDIDLQTMERSRAYNGQYFVLGHNIQILDEAPEKTIRQDELLARVTHLIQKGLKEIIIAMSANTEGEHTAFYITTLLKDLVAKNNVKISTLGRGLSTGTELEYSDGETLKSAVQNRR